MPTPTARQRPLTSDVLHRLERFSQSAAAAVAALVLSLAFLLGAVVVPHPTELLTVFEALAATVTLVMVFTLQHTQARQQVALQRKLDEILRALPEADNRLVQAEAASQDELEAQTRHHSSVRDDALRGT